MHIPVLLNEVIKFLSPKEGDFLVDATTGSGGHSKEILKHIGKTGKMLCIDWDKDQIAKAKENLGEDKRIIFNHANYGDLENILTENNLGPADGILVDLGFSSDQLERSGRGFSFSYDEPLDMRFDAVGNDMTAMEAVNSFREEELTEIIWKYGEERRARRIARAIMEARQKKRITTTFELVEIILSATGERGKAKIHSATKTFQALRIYVNEELKNLENLLKGLEKTLKPNGRIAIISFHSLEDRIVKNYFKGMEKEGKMEILTKKPIIASPEEVAKNPRSRSAKLRAGKKKQK